MQKKRLTWYTMRILLKSSNWKKPNYFCCINDITFRSNVNILGKTFSTQNRIEPLSILYFFFFLEITFFFFLEKKMFRNVTFGTHWLLKNNSFVVLQPLCIVMYDALCITFSLHVRNYYYTIYFRILCVCFKLCLCSLYTYYKTKNCVIAH